jgi:carboxyl-terminal processing protease
MKKYRVPLSAIVYAFLLAIPALALAPVSEETLDDYGRSARIVALQMPRAHISHRGWSDDVATNALSLFLDALDSDHSTFLASDVAEFEARADELDDELSRGEMDFAFKVYERYMQRLSNRVDYVDELLDQGFDVDKEEVYQWRRKDMPWPADRAAWDELWRKKVKNQYVGRLVSKTLDDEEAAAETNATSEAEAESALQESEQAVPDTPEESIRKQYERYYSVLEDNDVHWLLTLYISSFARAYDPHSTYMSANDQEDFDINMSLSLVGIGAMLSREDGAAKVVSLITGGPAEQDGRLQPGDKIIAVGQGDEKPVDIMHWPLSKSVRLIRGEKGTTVVLHVIPASDRSGTTVKKIDIVRDEVKLEEKAAKGEVIEIEDAAGNVRKMGLLTVPEFYSDISGKREGVEDARSLTRDVREILADLKTNRIEGLLLDLRNNSGGALTEAIEMTGLFIKRGPVVQVKGGRHLRVLSDRDPELMYDGPMVVLVNRQSASASEILAGALKDYGRALIVGDTRTHGKGTVQSLISLDRRRPELGSLKFTSASFHRIEGHSTQKIGVEADIHLPSPLDNMEVGEEYLPNALPAVQVPSLRYNHSREVAECVDDLVLRSQERREEDERYRAYSELLDYLAEVRKADTVSLHLDERLQMARRERRMSEYLEKGNAVLSGDGTGGEDVEAVTEEDEKEKADLVREESLHILVDMIDLLNDKSQKELTQAE